MFDSPQAAARLLDAGAGVGSLTAALVSRAQQEEWQGPIHVTAVELDGDLQPALRETLTDCSETFACTWEARQADFIAWACARLGTSLFDTEDEERFDLAILNPPYRKLSSSSSERARLAAVGIDATNLYAAFVALALRLLNPGGQLVAITPRSFCNGPYFKAFRKEMLDSAVIRHIHVFESRDKAFRDTDVLQENVIIHLVKGGTPGTVQISSSAGNGDGHTRTRIVPYANVVHPSDPASFVHIVTDDADGAIAASVRGLPADLVATGASVSTGRVVDFRAQEHLRDLPGDGTVPLLYPLHVRGGVVTWPMAGGKKPNALVRSEDTDKMLLPVGNYVLVKRFSTKEERRRVVATVLRRATSTPRQWRSRTT